MTAATRASATIDLELYSAMYEEAYPVIASFVSRQGGSKADAEDIFQDTIVALFLKADRSGVQDHTRYVIGIAKHLWLRKTKKALRVLPLDTFEQSLTVPEEIIELHTPSALFQLLQRVGKRCLDLLSDFYFSGYTIAEVAVRNGLGSTHSASVQKHKCVEKMRNVVKQKALNYDDLA